MLEFVLELILLAPPILFALTIHEVSHGLAAYRLGDPTAKQLGRLSLNPLKHLDPLGTLAFFIVKFGWAKPVPVNPGYFRNPRRDMMLVALAGPASNLAIAMVSAMLARTVALIGPLLPFSAVGPVLLPLQAMLVASVWINLVLCILNLLPIPPLDGSRILGGMLPEKLAASYQRCEQYGFIILIVLLVTGLLGELILPVIRLANALLID